MDYKALGLVAGIEIHQQLDTKEKLFCHCPTTLREIAEHNGEFFRYLRATVSEMGEIDRAAKEEMKHDRKFQYYTYDTTCLVENDEEPPAPLNDEALAICLTIGKMFGMTPVPQVHTMRKLVIDGSNTSGFQRTALVAFNGALPNGGQIETICLEEEAAQRVKDEVFSLDRLGIPLVEITTSPCMHTPEEVQSVAEHIGMVLRSTGKVKRGLGTIRQDVNISIAEGARVEIKGVQELDLIAEVVRREVQRQQNLLAIRDELRKRGASADATAGVDVTALFKETKSAVLKKAKKIHAIVLKGFAGLVGREIQPERRLGSEMSDYAKKCGVGGIFHTDELPAYGVTAEEVAHLRIAHACRGTGLRHPRCRCKRETGCVCNQPGDHPGKPRTLGQTGTGRDPEDAREREHGLHAPAAGGSPDVPGDRCAAGHHRRCPVECGRHSRTAHRKGGAVCCSIRDREELCAPAGCIRETPALRTGGKGRYQTQTCGIHHPLHYNRTPSRWCGYHEDYRIRLYLDTWHAVEDGKAAREAIPEIFRSIAGGSTFAEAMQKLAPAVSREELETIVRKIIADRADFVAEKGKAALGPLMGVVMAEVRGSVDGKIVSEILKREINAAITPK